MGLVIIFFLLILGKFEVKEIIEFIGMLGIVMLIFFLLVIYIMGYVCKIFMKDIGNLLL